MHCRAISTKMDVYGRVSDKASMADLWPLARLGFRCSSLPLFCAGTQPMVLGLRGFARGLGAVEV